ncbi:MAG: AbrB/MazE/SpoVT family DNA-binding domain-containing protein [Thermoleophilia bacterium]|nr:AbrB/MazE/SpoVT family DNA-binding domain-containing protein [Thermoleophilia bacterium]
MISFALRIDDRGRLVLPAALRRASGLAEGQEVVAVVDADGRIVISTADRLMDQLREACARMGQRDAASDLEGWRDESEADRLHRLEHPIIDSTGAARRGRELLTELGLE